MPKKKKHRPPQAAGPTMTKTAPDLAALEAAAPKSRWSDVLFRVKREGTPDNARREALAALAAHTGRPTIVCATAFHAAEKAQFATATTARCCAARA